jgi:hypothetical protein
VLCTHGFRWFDSPGSPAHFVSQAGSLVTRRVLVADATLKRPKDLGHTCCQLFVTDKGFVYVVPLRRKGEVLQAIKQFAKGIGAPDAFIADMSGEQMSREVKKFCNDIGTTLRASEEGTPWSNRAEWSPQRSRQARYEGI